LRSSLFCLALGDVHSPFHDWKLINKAVKAAKNAGIDILILAGDAIENDMLSSYDEGFTETQGKTGMSAKAVKDLLAIAAKLKGKAKAALESTIQKHETPDFDGEYGEVRKFFRLLADNFSQVIWIMGNHEDRTTRRLQAAFSRKDLSALFDVDNPKWKVSIYYHCKAISGGVEWQLEHPIKTAGKGQAKFISNVEDTNIIMFHNHHFSVTKSASGKHFAIEPGCCVDLSRIKYEQVVHGKGDKHVRGAVMVIDGKPHLLQDGWTDWEGYGVKNG